MSGRCRSCDSKLSDSEMCRKHAETGEYLDLCTSCLREVVQIVDIPVEGEPILNYTIQDELNEKEN